MDSRWRGIPGVRRVTPGRRVSLIMLKAETVDLIKPLETANHREHLQLSLPPRLKTRLLFIASVTHVMLVSGGSGPVRTPD